MPEVSAILGYPHPTKAGGWGSPAEGDPIGIGPRTHEPISLPESHDTQDPASRLRRSRSWTSSMLGFGFSGQMPIIAGIPTRTKT